MCGCRSDGPVEPLRQMTQQALSVHSLTLMEPGNESQCVQLLASTVSAAGAGWPGAAAYSALIKAGLEGVREANSPTPNSLLQPHPFTRAIAGLYL